MWEETGVFAASAPAFGVSGLSSGWGRGLQSNNSDTTISVPANENENYSA